MRTGRALSRWGWTEVRSQVRAALFAAVATLVLVACGGGTGGGDAGSAVSTGGGERYQASCASCHGADLRGTSDGPSLLSIFYEPGHHSDDSFRSAVANGARQHHWSFGDMEPVDGLSSADVDAIIDHVRQTQRQEGFER